MKYADEVENFWVVKCPECGSEINEWEECVDIFNGIHPVVTCENEGDWDDDNNCPTFCGCVFEVTCVEC